MGERVRGAVGSHSRRECRAVQVPASSPIFKEVVDTIRVVVGWFEAAVKLVDEYVERRRAADQAKPETTVQPSRGRKASRIS